MNRRYLKAILWGIIAGIFALACTACFPEDPTGLAVFPIRGMYIPFWDSFQDVNWVSNRLDLQYTAVLCRFGLLSLESGFYYLMVPILFLCGMAWLDGINEPYSHLIAFRRAVKSTGKILLFIYLIAIVLGLIGAVLSPSRLDQYFLRLVTLLWVGFKAAISYGIAFVFFVFALMFHMNAMANEPIKKVIGSTQSGVE